MTAGPAGGMSQLVDRKQVLADMRRRYGRCLIADFAGLLSDSPRGDDSTVVIDEAAVVTWIWKQNLTRGWKENCCTRFFSVLSL